VCVCEREDDGMGEMNGTCVSVCACVRVCGWVWVGVKTMGWGNEWYVCVCVCVCVREGETNSVCVRVKTME